MGISKRTQRQEEQHYEREEKREALMEYFKSLASIKKAEDEVLQFMIARSGVKGIAYDRKGSPGGGEPMMQEDYYIEQRELEEAVDKARKKSEDIRKALVKWMGETGEDKEGLLRMRYIRGMDPKFIGMTYTWSRSHTERMLGRAIDSLKPVPKYLAELLDD